MGTHTHFVRKTAMSSKQQSSMSRMLRRYKAEISIPGKHGGTGARWFQAVTVGPETNYCTNANKATGVDQACADPGNSAWNTHTSSVTKKPVDALVAPYPDHPGVTYGVQGEVYTA